MMQAFKDLLRRSAIDEMLWLRDVARVDQSVLVGLFRKITINFTTVWPKFIGPLPAPKHMGLTAACKCEGLRESSSMPRSDGIVVLKEYYGISIVENVDWDYLTLFKAAGLQVELVADDPRFVSVQFVSEWAIFVFNYYI